MTTAKPVVLVLGMPASGKTTAGCELAQCLQVPFRSMGDVLRTGRDSGTIPCCKVDPATEMLSLELLRTPEEFVKGFVLDFSPVTTDGGERLKEMLQKRGFSIGWVVYVRASLSDVEKRYVCRGKRPGDPIENIRLFFKRRITEEFRPFTLPMVRSAHKLQKLLILDNCADDVWRKDEAKRVASIIMSQRCVSLHSGILTPDDDAFSQRS